MIRINITAGKVSVIGHSGYAPPGQDIVCAAVSVLTQNLINSIEELTDDKISYDIKPGRADIYFGDPSEGAKLLIDSLIIGISAIAAEYPEHVNISERIPRGESNTRRARKENENVGPENVSAVIC